MIRGIQGRGEAHASVGIAHAQAGLALGHGRAAAAQPAAIVTLSKQGRALARQAIEAERAHAPGQRAKGAKRPAATQGAALGGALAAGTGAAGAAEATGAIETRRAIPRGIAKKLATSLSVGVAAPTAVSPTTASPATRTAVLQTEAATTTATASAQRARRGPPWGHLIRPGGQEADGRHAGGLATAAEPTARAERPEKTPAMGRGTLHEAEPRPSARALMQAAAARLVAEARTRRDDQQAELAAGPANSEAEKARSPQETTRATAASRAPQAANAAVAAAAEQAGLALPVPETSAP
jgi:hypothetical protein